MAPPLLAQPSMPEPDDHQDNVERHVVYETVSSSSSRGSMVTIAVVVVIALALIVWVVMQMR